MAHKPGNVRDAIAQYFETIEQKSNRQSARVAEIWANVDGSLGGVPRSSVRSYLQIGPYESVGRGLYRRQRPH
jgi:hypothetical protein